MYVECRYIDYILFNSDGQERSHHVERKTRTMPELLPMFLNAQDECAETIHKNCIGSL